MEKIQRICSTAIPLDIENIDTDQIIPARFLKATSKEGFGKNLFRDWRYHQDGTPNQDFVFNDPKYRGEILVAGRNFGCGSSREHAAWAIADYGIKVIISSFFADIFKANALNNSILPVLVEDKILKEIFDLVHNDSNAIIKIDLPSQMLSYGKKNIHFDIDPYKKMCLLNGYDDIDFLCSIKDKIESFIQNNPCNYSGRVLLR